VSTQQHANVLRHVGTLFNLGTVRELTDGQLLEKFATGSGELAELVFAALVERHSATVLRTCRSVLRNEHDVQDAFQATFLVLVRKSRTLWVQDSLGAWLQHVAYRAACFLRSTTARRIVHERKAAGMRTDFVAPDEGPNEFELILHEEVERLSERYRIPVILCDLGGCSHEQVARHLGCPIGTVKSRLARGRERLRGRLIRRGLAPATGALGFSVRTQTASAALIESTASVAVQFALGVGSTGCERASVASLAKGVLRTMSVSKLNLVVLPIAVLSAVVGTGILCGARAAKDRPAKPPEAHAAEAPTPPDPPEAVVEQSFIDALKPGPAAENFLRPEKDHVDRLDFGALHVGAVAETELAVVFRDVQDRGMGLAIDGPEFVTVKTLRVFRRGKEQPGVVYCAVTVSIDTSRAGKQSGDLSVRLGNQTATIPVIASVSLDERRLTKVLVISSGFLGNSFQSDYYRPWFKLVDDAKLDVSYAESLGGLRFGDMRIGPDGRQLLPEELRRYDVILLADGGPVFLDDNAILLLERFVESGKRLVVTASPFIAHAVLHSNRILRTYGMEMAAREPNFGGLSPIQAEHIIDDPLTAGLKKLSTQRPGPIRITDPKKAKILATIPGTDEGFIAVSRLEKGEIVVISTSLVSSWIGDHGVGTNNAHFLWRVLSGLER
jgi:RNA polymerase sigma factor (sigma-70 family)